MCRMAVTIIGFLSIGLAFGDVAKYPASAGGYNVVWDSQSSNSSESMPVGGGDGARPNQAQPQSF
jgi:hypothetical protein